MTTFVQYEIRFVNEQDTRLELVNNNQKKGEKKEIFGLLWEIFQKIFKLLQETFGKAIWKKD